MKNFKYEQGEESCSILNQDLCKDKFLYSTLSSWVGNGKEVSAQIKLKPVQDKIVTSFDAQEVDSAKEITAAPVILDLPEEEEAEVEILSPVVDVSAKGCQDLNPSIVPVMIAIISVLTVLAISMGAYYMYLKNQFETK